MNTVQPVLEVFQSSINSVFDTTGLPISIWAPDEDKKIFQIVAAVGLKSSFVENAAVDENSVVGETFISGQTIVIRDLLTDNRWKYKELAKEMGWTSVVCVPIQSHGQTIGVISVFAYHDSEYLEALEQVLNVYVDQLEQKLDPFEVILTAKRDSETIDIKLTPQYLINELGPYLQSISEIEYLIREVRQEQSQKVMIYSIRKQSPLSVSLDGATETLNLIRDTVVPWRREHTKLMSQLSEQEKQMEIENKKADILEKRARARKDQKEADRLVSEVTKQHAETERIKLENEKLRLELQEEKIRLALDILARLAPNLTETEKVKYFLRLFPHLELVLLSELEISID